MTDTNELYEILCTCCGTRQVLPTDAIENGTLTPAGTLVASAFDTHDCQPVLGDMPLIAGAAGYLVIPAQSPSPEPTPAEQSWDIQCLTCDWQYTEDGDVLLPGEVIESKRDALWTAKQHDCETLVRIKPPGGTWSEAMARSELRWWEKDL